MCGIVGIYQRKHQHDVAHLRAMITTMNDRLHHRGPDDAGIYVSADAHIALGSRRLSILDLSPRGHMPMSDDTGRYWLTFNGEIYNYLELRADLQGAGWHFHSDTDTEVLLKAYLAWGIAALERLNGMFAFALWDAQAKALFLARDRLGIKPLYVFEHPALIAFASEIKALQALPELDITPHERGMVEFIEHGYSIAHGETLFTGVRHFPPAQYVTLDTPQTTLHASQSYWQLPEADGSVGLSAWDEVQAAYDLLLQDAVRLRLRSDVPVGVSLSGGLDSSTLVALLSEQMTQAPLTFSSHHPVAAYDESYYFRLVAQHFHTEAYEVIPDVSALDTLIPTIMYHLDEPTTHFGVLSQWSVMNLAKGHVKVMLDGQGGDETLAGYRSYLPAYLLTLAQRARGGGLGAWWRLWQGLRTVQTIGQRRYWGVAWRALIGGEAVAAPPHQVMLVDETLYHDVTRYPHPAFYLPPSGLDTMLKHHLLAVSLPSLLRDEDKIAMAHSIENRVPLLDHRLVMFLQRLDVGFKLHQGWDKYLLRQTMKDRLPPPVIWRRNKLGYPTPLKLWLQTPGNPLYERLQHLIAQPRPWLNSAGIQQVHQQHMAHHRDYSRPLWRVLALDYWYERFWE